jgi:FlaA1/EpsC-like NDP-sugar epimerase
MRFVLISTDKAVNPMTIPEAARLVLQAAALAESGQT